MNQIKVTAKSAAKFSFYPLVTCDV